MLTMKGKVTENKNNKLNYGICKKGTSLTCDPFKILFLFPY